MFYRKNRFFLKCQEKGFLKMTQRKSVVLGLIPLCSPQLSLRPLGETENLRGQKKTSKVNSYLPLRFPKTSKVFNLF